MSESPSTRPISNVWVILALLFLWPLGLILMWTKTNWSKGIRWVVTILFVAPGILLSFAFARLVNTEAPTQQAQQQPSNTQSQSAQQQPTAQPAIVVDSTALVGAYDKNKLAADDKYKGKLLQTTGYITNISSDVMGSYYVSLKPSNDQYYMGTSIACYFGSDKSQLTSLANGQQVTVQGTVDAMSLGLVPMNGCKVVK